MFKKSLLVTVLVALPVAARAQNVDAGGTVTAPVQPMVTTGDVWKAGTLGLSVPFFSLSQLAAGTFESVPTIDLVYFLDAKSAVDLIAGINLHKRQVTAGTPPMTSDQTSFGFAAGVGYRVYTHKGALHSYLEPKGVLSWSDTSNSASLSLRAAFDFGLERMIADWFSFSGTLGAGIAFSNKFNDIQLATAASLAANFYWR